MGEILAAIPAHNEAKTIGSVVISAMQYVDEVAVIDDGSTDGTAWIAERAGATVIRHDGNQGYGAAIRWDADRRGLRIVEVPIQVDYDVDGSSQGAVRHGLSVVGSMVRYLETERPLTVFGGLGIALFIVGMIFGFAVLTKYYGQPLGQRDLPFGLSLLSVLFLVGGMMFAFTGLILHAVINANRRMR